MGRSRHVFAYVNRLVSEASSSRATGMFVGHNNGGRRCLGQGRWLPFVMVMSPGWGKGKETCGVESSARAEQRKGISVTVFVSEHRGGSCDRPWPS